MPRGGNAKPVVNKTPNQPKLTDFRVWGRSQKANEANDNMAEEAASGGPIAGAGEHQGR